MPDRLKSMEVFSKVVSRGGFSAAGRELGLSQTMVTKHVAALEAQLGVQLLHRSTHHLTPTEAGMRFAEQAEAILEQVALADASVSAHQVEPSGRLRINVPVSFGIREIAPLLADYARAFPRIELELGLNDRVVDLVEEGWDMAIRIGVLKSSALKARRLAPSRPLVCAAPSYLAAAGRPRSWAELSAHNCLGYTLSASMGASRWAYGPDGKEAVKVGGGLVANNGDALCAASVAGLGIIYQPSFIVGPDIRAGRLEVLRLDQPPVAMSSIHAVFPATREAPPKVRSMIDFLLARWSPEPPWDQGLVP